MKRQSFTIRFYVGWHPVLWRPRSVSVIGCVHRRLSLVCINPRGGGGGCETFSIHGPHTPRRRRLSPRAIHQRHYRLDIRGRPRHASANTHGIGASGPFRCAAADPSACTELLGMDSANDQAETVFEPMIPAKSNDRHDIPHWPTFGERPFVSFRRRFCSSDPHSLLLLLMLMGRLDSLLGPARTVMRVVASKRSFSFPSFTLAAPCRAATSRTNMIPSSWMTAQPRRFNHSRLTLHCRHGADREQGASSVQQSTPRQSNRKRRMAGRWCHSQVVSK
jgi:hypothetical protein